MQFNDLDHRYRQDRVHDGKVSSRKKVMYKDYALGRRIWEAEQRFSAAQVAGDIWYMEKYDRLVTKLYEQAGISET